MDFLAIEQERIEQLQTLASHQAQHQQHLAAIETTRQQLKTLQAEAEYGKLFLTMESAYSEFFRSYSDDKVKGAHRG